MGKRKKSRRQDQIQPTTPPASGVQVISTSAEASCCLDCTETQRQPAGETAASTAATSGQDVALAAQRLEEELCWCVGQLELGLRSQQPNSRQALEAQRVLRILKSSKAPLVKKRQAMRNTFGDYRKLMKAARKADKLKVSIASKSQPAGVKVIRLSTGKRCKHLPSSSHNSATDWPLPSHQTSLAAHTSTGGNGGNAEQGVEGPPPFQFNFSTDTMERMEDITDDEGSLKNPCSSIPSSQASAMVHEVTRPLSSYFHLTEPSEPFRFNFSPQDL